MFRLLLLAAALGCFGAAACMGFGEGWLGIEPSTDYGGWLALGGVFTSAAFMAERWDR